MLNDNEYVQIELLPDNKMGRLEVGAIDGTYVHSQDSPIDINPAELYIKALNILIKQRLF